MGLFSKKNKDTTVTRTQTPQAVIMFMSAIEKGIVGKVKRLIEQDHITSKAIILERCAGKEAPWRSNKITLLAMNKMGVSEELIQEKIKDTVNNELAKYKGLSD